jgi:hypothetical protein
MCVGESVHSEVLKVLADVDALSYQEEMCELPVSNIFRNSYSFYNQFLL